VSTPATQRIMNDTVTDNKLGQNNYYQDDIFHASVKPTFAHSQRSALKCFRQGSRNQLNITKQVFANHK